MKTLLKLAKPFWNPSAWIMIVFGALLFMLRLQFSPDGFINLPVLATLVELVGGLFIITGFQVMVSMLFWPDVLVGELLIKVTDGNVAAAIVLCGLKVFNGLSVIGFAIWLALAMNGAR
jgi:hypothetical protein